ncbi:SDR family oxidoreductase [Pseudomonas seleniipraecipitans]|uniref:SDR family oxidoreductase n=1 Tax=Phytopseudomonas seleniipraecipitans TaxID=640205 RepID=A0ABY5J8Y8_9GAMM|nr:SDR family oxidoreductase [Pseudomonas seleniipraecipitans]UUD64070.1 SDR family oxidoreductase [Pseudomonas seleniipraecipitans]
MVDRDKVLVTGSTGFLGAALMSALTPLTNIISVGSVRRLDQVTGDGSYVFAGDLNAETNWSGVLPDVQVVIHTAARAHVLRNELSDPLSEYRRVNVQGTLNLARQAATAGVRRFIFVSSIGVNGNINSYPFRPDQQPNPAEPYAQSKWEAEQGLWQIQQETGMEMVIIRPPLVYGRGAPGNFGSLVRWIDRGVPLPLGAIHNKRSLIGIDNLVDLIILCVSHSAAANQVLLVADGDDLSTTELLRRVGNAIGKPALLIPVPTGLLQFAATLLGKKAVANRLLGSLQVDISKTCELLEWRPLHSVEEGLVRSFRHCS